MSGVLWGLLGAVLIGGSDCIARVTAKRVSTSVLVFAIMAVSTCILSVWFSYTGVWPRWNLWAWVASALSGVLTLIALFFLYRALTRGPVAVASPAASVFTVLLVGLNALAGEPWSVWQLVAVGVVFLGVAMLARRVDEAGIDNAYDTHWLRITAAYGIASAVAISLRMFLAQEAGAILGAMSALYLNRLFALVAVIIVLAVQLIRQTRINWPVGRVTGLVLLQALLESAAFGSFLIGSATGGRIGATIGFSAFAAATALLASWWLRERIGWRRGLWIAVVGAGVVLAIIGSPSTGAG